MSKKRGKSGSAPTGFGVKWETELISASLDDDTWKLCVNFVVENQPDDELHIKQLANVVKIPQRRLFSHVRKEDLLTLIDEIGNPKTRKVKDLPQYFEVTEVIRGLLDAGEEIPMHLWAKLIKFALINVKTNDLKRRETEGKSKDEKGAKGSGKKRPRSKSPGKGGKGKKTPDPQLPKKDWSTLKKRGEEDLDNKYIDDEPDDGPQHYVFISGFRQAPILPILTDLGVNVSSVIKVHSESYATVESVRARLNPINTGDAAKDEEAAAVEKAKRESQDKEIAMFWRLLPVVLQRAAPTSTLQDVARLEYKVAETIHPTDWTDADNLVGFGTAMFEDLACLIYDSLDWRRQYLNYIHNMHLIHVPKFSEFDPFERTQSSSTEPHSVQSVAGKRDKGKPAAEPSPDDLVPPILSDAGFKDVDMRYYNDLMDLVPQESVSVTLVMHCMLEQLKASEEALMPPSEVPREQRNDGIHLALADCISDALEGLALSEEDRNVLSEDFPSLNQSYTEEIQDKNKKSLEPNLIQYGDSVSVRTHHLEKFFGFDPKDSEESLLHKLPCTRLRNYKEKNTKISKERAGRLQELLRTFTTLSRDSEDMIPYSEIDRTFKQFTFETMEISTVDENGMIVRPKSTGQENPWDDPYTLAAQNYIGEDLDAMAENEGGVLASKRNLDGWCLAEHFHPEVFMQVLAEAFESYPTLDTYYHKRDNSLLAVFHCPMNKKLHATEEWSTSLHSNVGFRNYLEYVSPAITEWTKVEEEKHRAELLKQELQRVQASQQSSDAPSATPPASTVPGKRPRSKSPKKGNAVAPRSSSKVGQSSEDQTYSTPYIRPGSLKAQSEEQAKLREEEEKRKAEKSSKQQSRVKSGDKKARSASSKTSQDGKRPGSGKGSKSGRKSPKSKSRSRSRSRSSSRERPTAVVTEPEKPEEPKLPFTGYDVGNNLIHLHGTTSYMYPCDGGIIKAEKIVTEQGSTTVTTTIRKDGHVFLVHLTDPKNPEETTELQELTQSVKKPEEVTEKAEIESPEKDAELASRSTSRNSNTREEKLCHSKFGSWTSTLCDGMTLSLSSHGENGECTGASRADAQLNRLLGEIPPATSPSPVPPGMETPGKKGKSRGKSPRGRSPRGKSPKGKRKGEADKEAEAAKAEEERAQAELERKLQEAKEEEERRRLNLPPFQPLYVSTPDGLTVRYQLDPRLAGENYTTGEMQYKLMVRQSYPCKTLGKQKTESLRAKPAMEEMSRCIRSDGTVVKIMNDGSTRILFADGTTCFNQGSGPLVQERRIPVTPHSMPSAVTEQMQSSAEEARNTASPGSKKGSKGRKSSGKTNPNTNTTATDPSVAGTEAGGGAGGSLTAAAGLEADAGASAEADFERASSWHTTTMEGESYVETPSGQRFRKDHLLCYTATDPVTGEILMSREDHVVRVQHPDGTVICDHSDGTRITQYTRDIEKHVYEAEGEDGAWELAPPAINTVRHVRVECPGFATVSFNCDEGSCLTVFGSGTNLLTTPNPLISHWHGGKIDIEDGVVTYTPRPDNDLLATVPAEGETEEGTNPANREEVAFEPQLTTLGSYVMRHNADLCCEAFDYEGNVFQVRKFGSINVMNSGNDIGSAAETGSNVAQPSVSSDPLDHHPPRFFIIHENGSGTELLRMKDVQEYVSDAEMDPTSAVIKEPLLDTPGVIGVTIMRPSFGNSSEAWIAQKMVDNIVPENIRSKDLKLIQHRVEKTTGPPFGTNTGKGLIVGNTSSMPQPLPVPPCPAVLELRQLVQHQPVMSDVRKKLKKNLLEVGKQIRERQKQREADSVRDPRSYDEKVRANDILSLVLEFDESQPSPKSPVTPAQQGLTGSGGQFQKVTKAAAVQEHQTPNIIRQIYEQAVTPPPIPKLEPPRNKLTKDDWDRLHRSLEEEKNGRVSLKRRDVPPYFASTEGRAWLMTQAPDLEALSRQMVPDPRRDGTEARMVKYNEKERETSQAAGSSPEQSRPSDNVSKTRPTNPTPAHATGKLTPTKVRPDNPTPLAAAQSKTIRPSNPTPSHASTEGSNATRQSLPDQGLGQMPPTPIPENPTSAQRREAGTIEDVPSSGTMVTLDTSGPADLVLTRSLLYDVNGEPRREKVRLPASILSDKPAAIPNKQFAEVEDPVRRKVKTSSVANAVNKGIAKRGFELLPPEIVFGVLKEGDTYSYVARLKNTGIDTCRFKIKQPPPGTGLRVHYAPGPVAAGMDTLLHIECYAIAVGVEGDSGVGTINHQLEIVTETETLCLPISALVLTSHDYDNRTEMMPPGGKAPGVKLLSTRPPSRDRITRPMKIAS